jgi:hypothetical protein
MLAERSSRFFQRRATGGTCQQLHTQFRFQPRQPATDDQLGHPKPERSRRNAARIGDLDEGLLLFDIHLCVPLPATQLVARCYYRDG